MCTTSFNIQKFCVLPTMYLCVLCGSQNKQRLFLYTAFLLPVLLTEIKPFTVQWLLCVPPASTFRNSVFFPHNLFICFAWISEQTAIISLHSISFTSFINRDLTRYSPVVIMCTTSSKIEKFCVLPTMYLCVLRESQNKKRLFLYTTLTYRFL